METLTVPEIGTETPEIMKTPQEVLAHAMRVIEERGWGQGTLENPVDGRVCVLGAINLTIYGDAVNSGFGPSEKATLANDARNLLASHIQVQDDTDSTYKNIYLWNDDRDQTEVRVMNTLNKAAR